MSQIQEYIISVVAAAIICAIIQSLTLKNTAGTSIIKLLCGVFLAITVIAPLKSFQFEDITEKINILQADAKEYTNEGITAAVSERNAIIKKQTEAYVTNRAESIGLDILVSVQLSDQDMPLPEEIEITGSASPYKKEQLNNYISQDIGIAKENIIWISNQ